ncbi:similar to An12g05020 [Aspergillus luchuensis IFO 4308]|nr:similar to An12g05020 [Aspergillus luchuensis IFO 4308]
MRFLAVIALLASVAVARPAENGALNALNVQVMCLGRDAGLCVGGNITAAGNNCCPPLVCGSDRSAMLTIKKYSKL